MADISYPVYTYLKYYEVSWKIWREKKRKKKEEDGKEEEESNVILVVMFRDETENKQKEKCSDVCLVELHLGSDDLMSFIPF